MILGFSPKDKKQYGVLEIEQGQVRKITIKISLRPIGDELRGQNFREDAIAKTHLKNWLNRIWEEKDALITDTLNSHINQKSK